MSESDVDRPVVELKEEDASEDQTTDGSDETPDELKKQLVNLSIYCDELAIQNLGLQEELADVREERAALQEENKSLRARLDTVKGIVGL